MLQLRCKPLGEEALGTDEQEFLLDLAVDPAQLLFTLNVCRLMMPPDTDPIHLANWREIESLIRQLSIIYRQAQPGRPMSCCHGSGRRASSERRLED